MKCSACERGDHQNCGMQTWCDCECEGPDGIDFGDIDPTPARDHLAEIKAYVAGRDAVLLQDNLPAFIAFAAAHNQQFSSEHVAEMAMHKMRTGIRTMPDNLRSRSKKWLQAQGYGSWDDGDVAGLHRSERQRGAK